MSKQQNFDEMTDLRILNTRYDDNTSAFLARQLTHVRVQALTVKRPPLEAFSTFPVQTDVPPGAETALQRVYDSVGMAKIISDYSDDLPRVDLYATEHPTKVYTIGLAYGYTLQEVQNAQFAGANLNSLKAEQVRRGTDRKINQIAWKGEKNYNIIGFLNNPNISELSLKADGASGSTKFVDKTAKQIIRDVKELLATISDATNDVEKANCLYLSPDAYAHIATTPRTDVSDSTILDFIKKAFPYLIKIEERQALKGAGEGGKDLMVAGVFEPAYIKLEIPERFKQLPVEPRNLEFIVNCTSRAIGVTVNYPMAFAKASGI